MAARKADTLTIEHALLGFLREQPRHGYAIYQELTDPAGLWIVWRMKQSQLYALLSKLDDQGLLTSSVEPQEGRPPRKVYRLTDAGEAAFLAWVKSPVAHGRQFRMDFLAKLFFARREGQPAVGELIDAQRAVCREWLDAQQTASEETSEDAVFQQLVHQYRTGQIHAMLDWLDACENATASLHSST